MRALVGESATRQQRELALHVTKVQQEFDAQRQADLLQIEQRIGWLEGMTSAEMARQRELVDLSCPDLSTIGDAMTGEGVVVKAAMLVGLMVMVTPPVAVAQEQSAGHSWRFTRIPGRPADALRNPGDGSGCSSRRCSMERRLSASSGKRSSP